MNNHSREDDSKWPVRNKDGRQELEIRLGNEHVNFEVMSTNLSVGVDVDRLRRSDR